MFLFFRFNLESIVQKCKRASIHYNESVDNLFGIQFKNILFHHHEIITLVVVLYTYVIIAKPLFIRIFLSFFFQIF